MVNYFTFEKSNKTYYKSNKKISLHYSSKFACPSSHWLRGHENVELCKQISSLKRKSSRKRFSLFRHNQVKSFGRKTRHTVPLSFQNRYVTYLVGQLTYLPQSCSSPILPGSIVENKSIKLSIETTVFNYPPIIWFKCKSCYKAGRFFYYGAACYTNCISTHTAPEKDIMCIWITTDS